MKEKHDQIENAYSDLQNKHDRETELSNNRIKFIEQQKDTAKRENEESQRNFTMTLESMQKKIQDLKSDKDQAESRYKSLEGQVQLRVKDIQDSNAKMIEEIQRKNKTLERENKSLADKIEMVHKLKQSEAGSLEKKYEQAMENERRIKEELDLVKSEREQKIFELTAQLNKEREEAKQKLREVEGRKGNRELNMMQLQMEFEKERASWESMKTSLQQQKDEACDSLQRMEKRYDAKVQELERLRNDYKDAKKRAYQLGGGKGSMEAAAVGKGIIGKFGLAALKDGNTSTNQGSGFKPTGFVPSGGTGFKATGASRFIGDTSSYKGDPNESFQSNVLNSSLLQSDTLGSARKEEDKQ